MVQDLENGRRLMMVARWQGRGRVWMMQSNAMAVECGDEVCGHDVGNAASEQQALVLREDQSQTLLDCANETIRRKGRNRNALLLRVFSK